MPYFLGADVGSSKTHVVVADEAGRAVGFGQSGSGNHETVGYEGLIQALRLATQPALEMAQISRDQIVGAGFGIAGFDWPVEKEATLNAIAALGLSAPVAPVNDALIGLLAGSKEGWGVAVVSGTGCNCRGWDRTRQREGWVTGAGLMMGEGAGGSELMAKAVEAVAQAWTGRGPATQLTSTFLQYTQARDLHDLLHGLSEGRFHLSARAAPLVFEVAAKGDGVASGVIRWAGCELGELAKAVIRQLGFEALAFDVVMVGSLFNGGAMLIDPMQATIQAAAPHARFVRLGVPPVVGAVLLGMEQVGLASTPAIREALARSVAQVRKQQAISV
jgi:N-acetylglucosamine kinase-like BadF-type ATPase